MHASSITVISDVRPCHVSTLWLMSGLGLLYERRRLSKGRTGVINVLQELLKGFLIDA